MAEDDCELSLLLVLLLVGEGEVVNRDGGTLL